MTDSGQKFSVFFDPYLFIYTIGHDIYLTELQGRINGTSSHSSQQSGTVRAGETRSSAPLAQQTQSSQAEESQAEDSFTAGSAASQFTQILLIVYSYFENLYDPNYFLKLVTRSIFENFIGNIKLFQSIFLIWTNYKFALWEMLFDRIDEKCYR